MEPISNGLICLIDWCAFTIPQGTLSPYAADKGKPIDVNMVAELLKLPDEDFIEMPRGLNGYSKQKACGDIRILYEGAANMGIHVLMSGQGCRQFETYYDMTWEQLFYRVREVGGHWTRLDLAVDDIRYKDEKPFWTVRQLVRKMKRNECRSKFKSGLRMESLNLGTGESTGDTLYAGSPQSLIKVRMYEKDLERVKKGMQLQEDLTTWNRLELEMRDDRADSVVDMLLKGMEAGEIALGVLAHYVDFVDRQRDDDNKARWPRTAWWEAYLNAAGKLRLARRAPDRTIDHKRDWIERQTLPTLAQVMFSYGAVDYEDVIQLLEDGLERMTEAQWAQLEEYRAQQLKRQEKRQEQQEVRKANNSAQTAREFWSKKKSPSGDGGPNP